MHDKDESIINTFYTNRDPIIKVKMKNTQSKFRYLKKKKNNITYFQK